MSREIKFRVWDKNENDMVRWELLNDGIIDLYHLFFAKDKNLIIQQFTGLKDKNGKEVYEGDIVNVIGSKRIGLYTTEIIHSGLGFCLKENNTILKDYKIVSSAIEVIGNIHETPELLQS